MRRRLAVIPIIHAEADLGQLASRVRARFGAQAWRRKQVAVAERWSRVRSWCRELDCGVERVLLYQDGLPAAKEAEHIVRELAASRSVNHRILLELMERGAELVGTEDPALLLREYELVRDATTGAKPSSAPELAKLLEQRDAFIASRIGQTLPEGATGVLFIGALHRVEPLLAADIQVDHPLGRAEAEPDTGKERRDAS